MVSHARAAMPTTTLPLARLRASNGIGLGIVYDGAGLENRFVAVGIAADDDPGRPPGGEVEVGPAVGGYTPFARRLIHHAQFCSGGCRAESSRLRRLLDEQDAKA